MTNDGTKPVACGTVILTIPHGDPTTSLTDDPSSITTAAGDSTPWAVSSDGSGTVYAVTLPPATGLAAGEAASFTLGAVIVNKSPGGGRIDVAANVDGVPVHDHVLVQKDHAAQPGEGAPVIDSFTVDPERIAKGGQATVSWQVQGATTCVLEPGPVPLTPADHGSLPVTVHDSTIYRLVALSSGGTDTTTATATVMPVSIDSFVASPPGPVTAGVEVTLSWRTAYADTRSIDQGVGPVDASGSVKVTPTQTTVYTLTASGLDQRSAAVTVTVTP
jgi:hypothetical protein